MGIDLGDTTQVSECSSQWIGSTRKSILKNRTTQLGHALTIKHEGFRRCSLHPGIQFSDSAYLQWVCFKIAIMTVWLSVFPHSQTKNAQCSLTTYISILYIYIYNIYIYIHGFTRFITRFITQFIYGWSRVKKNTSVMQSLCPPPPRWIESMAKACGCWLPCRHWDWSVNDDRWDITGI